MTRLEIDFGPEQIPITIECIEKMISSKPRRMKLSLEWQDALKALDGNYPNWRLLLPFCETLRNVFNVMCPSVNCYFKQVKDNRCFTFLNDAKEDERILDKIKHWLSLVGNYVAIRDCLAISFAIDYDREGGNPARPQTRIGALRYRAKPYDGNPMKDTFVAAEELIRLCLEFIENIDCYKIADVLVAMPPSDPRKPFNLPVYLAGGIGKALSKPDLTNAISTVSARNGLKVVLLEKKLQTIEGTISVDGKCFKDKSVLLIDDLYQSGISINYAAMLLLKAGATRVFGLACEKTCSNDDNVTRRGT